jgi:hypothetical protein
MGARVFISCGQRPAEHHTAQLIADWFTAEGYRPYIAIRVQSVQDLLSGIIEELRRSDYYVFADFRREPLPSSGSVDEFRGSLFTHQELAIAYVLDHKAIFFRQQGVRLEGMASFMASNATPFGDVSELPALIPDAVRQRQWTPSYSRNLVAVRLHTPDQRLSYPGGLLGRAVHVDIQNCRPDVGAGGTIARLARLHTGSGSWLPSPNRSHLKVTGQPGFSQTIWPLSHGAFDLLFIHEGPPRRVFLNNALDISPRPPLLGDPGRYLLEYQVFAERFDVIRFAIALWLPPDDSRPTVELLQVGDYPD